MLLSSIQKILPSALVQHPKDTTQCSLEAYSLWAYCSHPLSPTCTPTSADPTYMVHPHSCLWHIQLGMQDYHYSVSNALLHCLDNHLLFLLLWVRSAWLFLHLWVRL